MAPGCSHRTCAGCAWLACGPVMGNGMSEILLPSFFCQQEQGLISKIGLVWRSLTCLLFDSFFTVHGRVFYESQKVNTHHLHFSELV